MKANSQQLLKHFLTATAILLAVWLTPTKATAFTVLAGWDMNGLTGGGPTNLSPTTAGAGLTVSNLERGSGIGQGTATTSFGGNRWTNTDEISAASYNEFITCSISTDTNYTMSFNGVDQFNYTHSGTGPANGVFQYSMDGVNFTDVQSISYSSSGSVTIDLSSFPDLQNVGYGTNVTFRIVNWGASGAAGTWYIKDLNSGNDFEIVGTITQISTGTPPGDVTVTPTSIVTNSYSTVNFTVSAAGDQPTYSWYQEVGGTTNLVSTDGPTLTLANVTPANSGNYQVVLVNDYGSATSSVVDLTVSDPAITAQPVSQTNVLNDVDYFNATVVSSQPVQLLWYYNGNVISNLVGSLATNATTIFVQNTTAATNLTGYYLVASNQFGMVTSVVVTATVAITPSIEITRWDFNQTNEYTPFNPAPSLGSGTAMTGPSAGVTNFIFAPGAFFDPNQLVTDATNQAWELDGFNAGIDNKTAGFQYNVSTAGYKNILLTWSERHSATASKYMRVQYSTNGVDFVDGDVITFNQVLYQFYSSDLSAVPGVADNPNFAFRIVAEWESTAIGSGNANYDGTSSAFGSGGTIREDLMTVFGDPASAITPIPLHIQLTGTNLVLTWDDPASVFSLQSAPFLTGTYTNVPSATSPYTNTITGTQQYFRLKSN